MSQPNFYSQPPNQAGNSHPFAQNEYAQDSFGQPYFGEQAMGAAVPARVYSPLGDGQLLMNLGRIQITSTRVITPSGTIPLGQARFTFIDQTVRTRRTPTWAVILAIVGFFIVAIFSLLFLLAKEDVPSGMAVIQVTGDGVHHQEYIQVTTQMQLQGLYAQVQQAQQMTMSGGY